MLIMKKRRINPFKKTYLAIGLISCILLSCIFFYANYREIGKMQYSNNLEKAEMMMEEFDTQLEYIEEVALKISVDDTYQLRTLKKDKYNEIMLLEELVLYEQYSTLIKEYFLYYGDERIFHSMGNVIQLSTYLEDKEVEKQEEITNELMKIVAGETGVFRKAKILEADKDLYIMIPFRVLDTKEKTNVVMTVVLRREDLNNRFNVVIGGAIGTVCIFEGDKLLYCNRETPCQSNGKGVLAAYSEMGNYQLYYLPDPEVNTYTLLIVQYILMFLVALVLITVLGNIFAEKAYRPIAELSDKYGKTIPLADEIVHKNALEEISYMMDNVLQNNTIKNEQISKNQRMLKNQVLQLLLEGSTFVKEPYLCKLQITLPGPHYSIFSVCYRETEEFSEEFFYSLQESMEKLSNEEEGRQVYGVINFEKKRLHLICSFEDQIEKEELEEQFRNIIRASKRDAMFGMGNTYTTLSRLSASYMESLDNIQREQESNDIQPGFIYDEQSLWRISRALLEGYETEAVEALNCFVEEMRSGMVSVLMQHYVFASFLSEISRQAAKCQIELSQQSISLIVTAKNTESFYEAARDLIHEFCVAVANSKQQAEAEEDLRICEYVKGHFTEYDLSIEKTAEELGVSKEAVRKAINNQTGKMYKDYLMYLRIEYAKILLLQENMTAEEVCQRVGYSSISYFTKLFKKETGVTPAKYKGV